MAKTKSIRIDDGDQIQDRNGPQNHAVIGGEEKL
jgi:hypothetical protein